ncbi:hypothetical protein ILUMI_05396 [Ignelater luminosus]|uniref:THAP domain-containing protein 9 n=1 Tax=Ignelater luminosus TaxID=2038154 RepID=A0A8K0GIQ0_IGNLU|nr:hypothetical protein ILUMI_05396 [Ignelater luminosus]
MSRVDAVQTPSTLKKSRTRNPKVYSPRTAKRFLKYKLKSNALRCKLFRRRKNPVCICGNKGDAISKNRIKVARLINESKNFLSEEAHILFTHQLKSFFKNKYNMRYTDAMKRLCLMWYYSSPKGYKNLMQTLNLPTPRTIRRWQSCIQMDPGINSHILESIKLYFKQFQGREEQRKLITLIFDEISLKEEIHYDASKDKIIGVVDTGKIRTNDKAKTALVCMIKGIVYNFKCVLGYWFLGGQETSPNMKEIVMNCVDAANSAGLIVKALVCDQGPANQGLATKLGITTVKTYFTYQNSKIYFIYDVPHLLKSTRSMLTKYNLLYKGKAVSWSYIIKAVESAHPVRLRLIPKVGTEHLNMTSKNPNVQQFENGLRYNYITTITKLSCNSNCEADFTTSLSILSDLSKKHKEELKQPQKADLLTTTALFSDSDIPELLENISLTDDNAIFIMLVDMYLRNS